MFSTRFLSSYCLFTAAVSAYRNTPEEVRAAPEHKAVVQAFKKATLGMSEKDKTAFIEYVLSLLHQPEDFRRDKCQRDRGEANLDRELGERGDWLVDDGSIISEAELIKRTGISHEVLAKKLRERRIFQLVDRYFPVWSDGYFPAFFADSKFDRGLLEIVSQALGAENGTRKYRFFTTPDPTLGNKTPLNVLADGDLDLVLSAVKPFRKRAT